MTDVKWIKMPVDFFEQMSARVILKMELGERILLIWIKLLCLAGKANRGGAILSEGGKAIGARMLPLILDEDEGLICNAVVTLKKLGLITEKRGAIYIIGFDEEQSLNELNRQKELTRARVKRYRERKREEEMAVLFPEGEGTDDRGECNADVTVSNANCNASYIDKNRKENNRGHYQREKKRPPRPSYGSFDTNEVFERVLARSYGDDDNEEE